MNQNIYHLTKDRKTIVGVTNNLKELFKYNKIRLREFKLEVHNEEVGNIVYPMSNLTRIVYPSIHKTYKFHSPCFGEIVKFNQEITLNPSKILENTEMENWLVEIQLFDKQDYPNYFNFDYNKLYYPENYKNYIEKQKEYTCYD